VQKQIAARKEAGTPRAYSYGSDRFDYGNRTQTARFTNSPLPAAAAGHRDSTAEAKTAAVAAAAAATAAAEADAEAAARERLQWTEGEPMPLPAFVECAVANYSRLRVLRLTACGLQRLPANLPRNLEELDVSHNHLTSLAGLSTMRRLLVLNVNNNALTSLSSLGTVPTLVELRAMFNRVRQLDGLGGLVALTTLDLAHNAVQSAAALRILAYNAKLRLLWIAGCPLTRQSSFSRAVVGNLLPQLCQLDGASLEHFNAVISLFTPPPTVHRPVTGTSHGQLLIGACARHVPNAEPESLVRTVALEGEWEPDTYGDREQRSRVVSAQQRHRPLYPSALDLHEARRAWREYEPLARRIYDKYAEQTAVALSVGGVAGRGNSASQRPAGQGLDLRGSSAAKPGSAGGPADAGVMDFSSFVKFLHDYGISPRFVLDNHTCLLLQLSEGSLLFKNKGINIPFETFMTYLTRVSLYYAWICFERQYPPSSADAVAFPEAERSHPDRVLSLAQDPLPGAEEPEPASVAGSPFLYEWTSYADVCPRCLPPEFLGGCIYLISSALHKRLESAASTAKGSVRRMQEMHALAPAAEPLPARDGPTKPPFKTGYGRTRPLAPTSAAVVQPGVPNLTKTNLRATAGPRAGNHGFASSGADVGGGARGSGSGGDSNASFGWGEDGAWWHGAQNEGEQADVDEELRQMLLRSAADSGVFHQQHSGQFDQQQQQGQEGSGGDYGYGDEPEVVEPGVASLSETVSAWLTALDDDHATTVSALVSLVQLLQAARSQAELSAGVLTLCDTMEQMEDPSVVTLQGPASDEMANDPRLEDALAEATARLYAIDELKNLIGGLLTQLDEVGCEPDASRAVAARVIGADWQRSPLTDEPAPLLPLAQRAVEM
jgi:hypothetical protein